MHRLTHVALALALLFSPALLVGCGGGEKVTDIQDSEQVKAADQAGQKAMEDYMRSKSQGR